MVCFNQLVEERIYPHLKNLCEEIYEKRHEMILDGWVAFPKDEPFLPGTIVSSFCYLLTGISKQDQDFEKIAKQTREIIEYNSQLEMSTFGILEFLSGIYRLQEMGIKEEILSETTENTLKAVLHWNVFVDEKTYELKKGLPTNYYGVAFRVALLREHLGWDQDKMSTHFLDILTKHIRDYSGDSFYMDETTGQGRYDKYTVTIASEICEAYLGVNENPPAFWVSIMTHMVKIILNLADEKGMGFTYGRSIGSHGTACVIENIPVAIKMNLIDNKEFAYSYCVRGGQTIVDFWYNKERGIFNIWDDGRRTNEYRGKHRVLEVNLDMSLKMIRANELLAKSGLHLNASMDDEAYKKVLKDMPAFSFYEFEKREYHRGMVIYRTDNHVYTLPIVNGADTHYKHISYLPLPFDTKIIQGATEEERPMLVPVLKLEDEQEVMPLSYMKDIKVSKEGDSHIIEWHQEEMCNIAHPSYPQKYSGITCHTRYVFTPNKITREDYFRCIENKGIQHIGLTFDTFATDYSIGEKITFKDEQIESIKVQGLTLKKDRHIQNEEAYHTPYGSLMCTFEWEQDLKNVKEHCIKWEIKVK